MTTFQEEIASRHGFAYLDKLEFNCDKLLRKVRVRCEKKLQKKHLQAYNNWSRSLFEEEMIAGKTVDFAIVKIHPLVGYGVIAKEKIAPLSFIGEYAGQVRKRIRKDGKNDYVFGYVIGPHDTPWVIDAAKKGNFTRFFNHSYSPNLISRWIITDNIAHIGFFSTRLINPGEEMTFDYGPYYWRKRPTPQAL